MFIDVSARDLAQRQYWNARILFIYVCLCCGFMDEQWTVKGWLIDAYYLRKDVREIQY